MKKLFIIFLILIFASSASATVYKWVDESGAINFADDFDKVPPQYRDRVEEVNIPKTGPSTPSWKAPGDARSDEKAKQPPIAQTLVREGDFAMKLAESLKMGKPAGEAEAESTLATAGIAPKNGWIADYPVTPDIIGELAKAVGEAADERKLGMGKEEALKALRTAAAELELPIIAEVPDGYTEGPSPTAPEYAEPPAAADDYYYTEGPPVITYYLPPSDYYYLYAWVPSPFWCSGFFFPGFYILHDFHRFHHHWHGHPYYVTNHIRDPQTKRIFTIDPVTRREGKTVAMKEATHTKGFSSTEARNAAQSIFERSSERSKIPSTPTTGRDYSNPAYPQPRSSNERQVYNKQNRMPETGTRSYGRPFSMNRQNSIYAQRPSTGQPFHAPSQGSGRSFSPAPQGGGQHFSAPSHGGGFSGSHHGGGGGGSFGHGGGRF